MPKYFNVLFMDFDKKLMFANIDNTILPGVGYIHISNNPEF